MRSIALLIAGAAAASCSMAPPTAPVPMRTADGQHQLDIMLAGRVPLRGMSCVPSTRDTDMRIIDANTLAFRVGTSVYIAQTTGCANLSPNGMYTLLTRQEGAGGLCRGDPAQVVEAGSAVPVGSCLITGITQFVPVPR